MIQKEEESGLSKSESDLLCIKAVRISSNCSKSEVGNGSKNVSNPEGFKSFNDFSNIWEKLRTIADPDDRPYIIV